MKKHLLLYLCCMALVISAMAQPENKKNLEKLYLKKYWEKEKSLFYQKQHQEKSLKNVDWWEPDTVYGYYLDGGGERNIYTYENGNCTVALFQKGLENQWQNVSQVFYTYNSQHNRIEELSQVWKSGEWQNSSKTIYTYNSQNQSTSYLYQEWKSEQWINVSKVDYTFDSQNNMTEELYQNWSAGQWRNYERYINTYDTHNNLTEITNQDWIGGKWENYYREINTYNSQNYNTNILFQFWENKQWKDDALMTLTYNEQNQHTSSVLQEWIYGQWINDAKLSFTYDEQNNQTSSLWQFWQSAQWENFDITTCSYDENNNAISGNYQYWAGNVWVDGDGWLYVYYNNMQSETHVEGYRFTATYIQTGNVGVKENNFTSSVHLYPNPVSNVLHIETKNLYADLEVKIYSIQGALLMNVKGGQIDVSSLPSGIYIAEINGIFRKIVKQ